MGENSEIYNLLIKIKNGYDPGWTSFSRYDELLDDIRFNEKKPILSTVTITFTNYKDFFNLYGDSLDGDDELYLELFLSGRYENDFDRYTLREDWEQGYVLDYLNNENLELINKIAFYLDRDAINMTSSGKSKLIYNEFDSTIDEIMYAWSNIQHECIIEEIQKELLDEFGNKFYSFGIREIRPLYKYVVSVGSLLRLFDMFKVRNGNISDVLKKIIEIKDESIGSYYNEMYWNTNCPNFDTESFNRETNWYLEKIYDEILDDEKFIDAEQYFELKKVLNDEYGFDKWIKIKTKDNLFFKVDDIDPKTNKIIITFRNNESDDREEKRSMTYDELKRMETQYELFNEIKKLRKKIFLN